MKPIVRSIIFTLCVTSVAVLSRCGSGSRPPAPLTITTPSLPNATLGAPYRQPIQATGGVAPFSWSVVGALPHNLRLVAGAGNTAMISGTADTAVQGVTFTIKVTDSANQSATQSYTLSILAEPDTLSFSPPTGLSFSPQLMGTASNTQAETVTNDGTSALAISSIGLTGTNATDFSRTNGCGSSLAAGANCSLTVSFTPSQLGPRSASITITDSAVGSPHSVSLSGIGLTSGSNATLSAGSLTFGNQVVGATSPAQSLTLSNYGSTTLSIGSIAVTANFGETDNCSGSHLASGEGCTINVTFTPSTAGGVTGTLSVTDNAPGSPQTVSLSGAGVPVNYTLTGWCVIPAGGRSCYHDHVPTQCPPGQRLIRLGIMDCFGNIAVDTARGCRVGGLFGYCAATDSGGSGAAAHEPRR